MMKEPPVCPVCGAVLIRVNSTGRSAWVYDQGHYCNLENIETTLSCPHCDACLDMEFGMGIYYWGIE